MMSSTALIVYGPEVARSGLTSLLDEFIRRRTGLELSERFFSIHSRKSIDAFYTLTCSTGGKHWPLVLDLFDMRPVCATIWSGPNALHLSQKLKGNTQPAQALSGTVRSLFFCDNPVTNLLHVSDSHQVMDAELRILRCRSLGDEATAWISLDSGYIAHSSFQMLLNVLGDRGAAPMPDNRSDGSAFAHATFCYDRALLTAAKSGLTTAVQRYFQGDRAGLEGLFRYAPLRSSWDRLILEAGLFSMPLWNCLLKRTVDAVEPGKQPGMAPRRKAGEQ
ncbi:MULTISPECIES: nucleoside-diphosphate kinase [unclassified Mesorhizobium]|uniref:nucleoside-diphosphate kinase n=1 Tax=unclassified Mesorhizobium TaxID=325217 RepID=UPI000B20D76B|nr:MULTISPECIES: nucleoside-diphosphate kinase [Mesorhizobium]